ncbi:MAG TPA: hypothetical protein VMY42_05150 [Thermoguttaceae bacterium]|nr:hypothetical protein [Thermoguttaceae bacterium]
MAFQFLCPQGHVLQGEESLAGQKCKCPYCHSEFAVPPPPGGPPVDETASGPDADGAYAPIYDEPDESEQAGPGGFPGIHTGTDSGGVPQNVAVQFGTPAAQRQSLLHIPCPQGHVLETPRDMLGQDAMCPFCERQFRLRFEDSREYRQENAERRALRDQKIGKAWMNWSIAAAVAVVLGLILLFAITGSK